jgi:hypothetical protein
MFYRMLRFRGFLTADVIMKAILIKMIILKNDDVSQLALVMLWFKSLESKSSDYFSIVDDL